MGESGREFAVLPLGAIPGQWHRNRQRDHVRVTRAAQAEHELCAPVGVALLSRDFRFGGHGRFLRREPHQFGVVRQALGPIARLHW